MRDLKHMQGVEKARLQNGEWSEVAGTPIAVRENRVEL
jgi:hypothetical protein